MLRPRITRHRPPVLALMAAALLTTVLTGPTSAGPGAPRDASARAEEVSDAAPGPAAYRSAEPRARQQVRRVAVRNPSFRQGTRHWTAAGRHDSIRPARDGRGTGSSVALSTDRPGPAELRPRNRLEVPGTASRVKAVAWVRTLAPATRVSILVSDDTPTSGKPLATRSYRVTSRDGWRRVSVSHRGAVPGSRLTLSVVATGLGRAALLVDDVTLRAVAPSSKGAGRSTWASGVSGDGAADGSFAAWRGSAAQIAGTWNDNYEAQQHQWTLLDGFEYGAWQGDLDVAVGGIFADRGDTWRAAAAGAYDARWSQVLSTTAAAWADRPGTLYLRFAHEFNGEWYPWKVTGGETAEFKAAWRRFRALQLAIMPTAELVFSLSSETSSSLGLDWRDAFPGREHVDVLSVDYYNQYPFVDTAKEFAATLDAVDATGAPRGLEAHRRFAQDNGLPFAISEWSSNASMGDSAAFMRQFRSWVTQHAGTGPGGILYEVLFNVSGYGEGQFQIAPTTRQPAAAKVYRKLW